MSSTPSKTNVQKNFSYGSAAIVGLGVTFISLLSLPVMYFLSRRKEMSDHMWVFYAGVFFCVSGS